MTEPLIEGIEPLDVRPVNLITRILVVGCSARKHPVAEPAAKVSAWDLYDGSGFRVMKALERDGAWPQDVGVWILSAEYGLIRRDYAIQTYDRLMDPNRAAELRVETEKRLRAVLDRHQARELFVFAGHAYRQALRLPNLHADRPGVEIGYAAGGIGVQLHQLRMWLLRNAEPTLGL